MEPLIRTSSANPFQCEPRPARGLSRRGLLQLAGGFAGVSWLTPLAELLAEQVEGRHAGRRAQSLILLWLAGGPSQLETFDPHPRSKISGGTNSIETAVKGIQLAEGLERLADQMAHASIVRSLTSKEGDHERGTYMVKTGYRPDPTVVHPSIGAICCHQLPRGKTEIPRHVSILPSQWPGIGGLLGKQYDAFKTYDPAQPVPDVATLVPEDRFARRLADLNRVEEAFARGRSKLAEGTRHRPTIDSARAMMSSEQLAAFDVSQEPSAVRRSYGDTPFGRGCLAARRLIEVGVRCVEVTLAGWDSHVNNHEIHRGLVRTLDPAISGLLADLAGRGLLDKTIVVCGGEFGRTPQINLAAGRDHWPHGFSMLVAGGGLRAGQVIGATDPEGGREVHDPYEVADLHATVLTALGIDPTHEELAPVGRPIKLSEGQVIRQLLPG
ncbi:MAG: DUF1501 domain-containing protein [Pirellulales bacterium]